MDSLKVVDEALLGYESFDIGEVIAHIKPDVIALVTTKMLGTTSEKLH